MTRLIALLIEERNTSRDDQETQGFDTHSDNDQPFEWKQDYSEKSLQVGAPSAASQPK